MLVLFRPADFDFLLASALFVAHCAPHVNVTDRQIPFANATVQRPFTHGNLGCMFFQDVDFLSVSSASFFHGLPFLLGIGILTGGHSWTKELIHLRNSRRRITAC